MDERAARRERGDTEPSATVQQALGSPTSCGAASSRGELRPGDRIRQESLAAAHGASRAPVREALRILQADGLVTTVANTGAWVARLSQAECEEIYQVRERLEPLLLRMSAAAPRAGAGSSASPISREQIEQVDDVEQFLRLDRALHLLSYEGAETSMLGDTIERLWNTTQHYRRAFSLLLDARRPADPARRAPHARPRDPARRHRRRRARARRAHPPDPAPARPPPGRVRLTATSRRTEGQDMTTTSPTREQAASADSSATSTSTATWRAGRRRRPVPGARPLRRVDHRRVRDRVGGRLRRRGRRRRGRAAGLERDRAAGAQRDPPPRLGDPDRGVGRASPRSWCARTASPGPTRRPRRATRRSSSAGSPRRRSGSPATGASPPPATSGSSSRTGPIGVVAAHHAVELPRRDGDAEARTRARRRLHHRAQARARDAAHRGLHGRRARAGRGAARRRQPGHPGADAARRSRGCSRPRPCGSCPSPARRRSAASCSRSAPTASSTRRWSSAATRPLIVLPGADLEQAVEGAFLAKMRNGGSACTSANRFYVHASLHDDVRRAR